MAGKTSHYKTSALLVLSVNAAPLEAPRPLSYSLAQDGMYSSFYLSVLTPYVWNHTYNILFSLLLCLMSTQFLDWTKESRGRRFSSSPTSHLETAVSDNQMQSHTEAPELSFLQMPSWLTSSHLQDLT